MKKLLTKILIVVMLVSVFSCVTAMAADITVYVDGSQVYFDQAPIIENSRTLVPLRAIFEKLGATVDWNNTTRTVTATKGDTTIKLTIGEEVLYKNGQVIKIDCPAKIVNSRTLVPVRAVAESFGCEVTWNNANYQVIISTKKTESNANNDFAFTALKKHIMKKGTEGTEGYSIQFPLEKIYEKEMMGTYVLMYLPASDVIMCGTTGKENGSDTVLLIRPSTDTYLAILSLSGKSAVTGEMKRSSVMKEMNIKVPFMEDEISGAYYLTETKMQIFSNLALLTGVSELGLALFYIESPVTVIELGFTQIAETAAEAPVYKGNSAAYKKVYQWLKDSGVYEDGKYKAAAKFFEDIYFVAEGVSEDEVSFICYFLWDMKKGAAAVFLESDDPRFYYMSVQEDGTLEGEGLKSDYISRDSSFWNFDEVEIETHSTQSEKDYMLRAALDLEMVMVMAEMFLVENGLPGMEELGFTSYNK